MKTDKTKSAEERKELLEFIIVGVVITFVITAFTASVQIAFSYYFSNVVITPTGGIIVLWTCLAVAQIFLCLWLIGTKHFHKKQRVIHLEGFKPRIVEHLHLLSVALQNFYDLKASQATNAPPTGRYLQRIKDEDNTLDERDLVFANAFWEYLSALTKSLKTFKSCLKNFAKDSLPELTFVGMHFSDPRIKLGDPSRVYYERGSGLKPGMQERAEDSGHRLPPILSLVSKLTGWCPITSILLHITSGTKHIKEEDIPDDCFCISIKDFQVAYINDQVDHKDHFVQGCWKNIYVWEPRKWSQPDVEPGFQELIRFRSENIRDNVRYFIDEAAERTILGLTDDPGGLSDSDKKEIMDYGTEDIVRLLKCKTHRGTISPNDPRYIFTDHLMQCFRDKLARISVDEILEAKNSGKDADRYIYYVLPGLSKGHTSAAYFICNRPIQQNAITELQMLFLPFALVVVDGLRCIQDMYAGTRSSEIMSMVYKLTMRPEGTNVGTVAAQRAGAEIVPGKAAAGRGDRSVDGERTADSVSANHEDQSASVGVVGAENSAGTTAALGNPSTGETDPAGITKTGA